MVETWVKNIVEENRNNNQVLSPKIDDIVMFKAFTNGRTYKDGDIYPVKIRGGRYWGENGVSNYWYWYRLDEHNKPTITEEGYGNFYTIT